MLVGWPTVDILLPHNVVWVAMVDGAK